MAQAVRERLGEDPADLILPVPLHPTRLRERTFNQALGLAQEMARQLNLPCLKHLLIRVKPTRPQAELSRNERLANLHEAFRIQPDPRVRRSRILLIDDVFTTGATAEACTNLLKQAGASAVIVVTVAHG